MAGVEVLRFPPSGAGLAAGLRRRDPALATLLPVLPGPGAEWQARLAQTAPRPLSGALAERLAGRQRALGAGPKAERAARALGEAATVAVVTGQQPGLLGGPLLTLHKAAGALNLARRLDGVAGRRVVALFWLASDDHDLDEANRGALLDRHGQATRVGLGGIQPDGRSLRHLTPPFEAVAGLREALAALLPATPRAHAALDALAPRPGEGFAAAAARALLAQLQDAGLVLLEPELLEAEAGAELADLCAHAAEIHAGLAAAATDLEARGFAAPLEPGEPNLPCFLRAEAGGPRRRLRLDGPGRVRVAGTNEVLEAAGLADLLRAEPARASPDVVGRVFVQNALLPVLAYVAGPTEIVYLAQVARAHARLGRAFPLAVPRPGATWVDARTLETLAAFGWSPEQALAAEAVPEPPLAPDPRLAPALDRAQAHLEALPLAALLAEGGRTAEAAGRVRAQLESAWARGREAIERARAADQGVARARWVRAWNLLRPLGRPQERVLVGLSIAARFGLDALAQGAAGLDPLAPATHLLTLGPEADADGGAG